MLTYRKSAPGTAAAADAEGWSLMGLGGFALPPAGRSVGRSHARIDACVSSGSDRPRWVGSGNEWRFLAAGQ